MPAPLDPDCLFRTLAEHDVSYVLIGGLAAVLHGSPAMTNDADIMPEHSEANLEHLSVALSDLEARLRVESTPDGVGFDPHPALLRSMQMMNLTTRCGDLDITFEPAGLDGFQAVLERSDEFELSGERVRVAALADIIRSKEAAGRPKDTATLPLLYALQDEIDRDRDG